MIIDFHSHLGDILHLNGGALIDQLGVRKKRCLDPISYAESQLHADFGLNKMLYHLLGPYVTAAEGERNLTATLENMRKSMDEAGMASTVVLPVHPYVTFKDVLAALQKDQGIIPFTSIDFTASAVRIAETLQAEVKAGAQGLKLHPIIQNIPLSHPTTLAAIETFAIFGLPVLVHCGRANYRTGTDRRHEHPEYSDPGHLLTLVRAFPKVSFIAGHSGLYEVNAAMAVLGNCSNVYVDTSFQSPKTIRELINVFGHEHVLCGSDWPWGSRLTAVAAVHHACKSDPLLEELLLSKNALSLLQKTAGTRPA